MISGIIFVFGLAGGSFLNVLIERLPKGHNIRGRSKCQNCKTQLNWQDLLPVFSFLLLKGRCRYCGSKISLSYPIVELTMAFLFLAVFKLSLGIFSFFIVSILLALAFSDIKYFILPNKLLFSEALIFILFLLFNSFVKGTGVCVLNNCSFLSILSGSAFLGGLFLILFLLSSGRWIGLGDAKLGFFLGAFSGFYWSLNVFYLSILLGTLASVFILFSGGNLKTRLPLGAFLSLATIVVLLSKLDFVGIILRF